MHKRTLPWSVLAYGLGGISADVLVGEYETEAQAIGAAEAVVAQEPHCFHATVIGPSGSQMVYKPKELWPQAAVAKTAPAA